jgi:hypothetical protein
MPEEPQHTRRVGIYDRPASADRPRARLVWIAVVVIAVGLALVWLMRR